MKSEREEAIYHSCLGEYVSAILNSIRTPWPLLFFIGIGGCGKKLPPLVVSSQPRITLPKTVASSSPVPGAIPSVALAPLSSQNHGPYLASHGDHALLLIVTSGSHGQTFWRTQALDEQGQITSPPRDLGPAPEQVELLSLRPGRDGGFSLAWARQVEGGHILEVRELDAEGAPRGKSAVIHQTADAPAWMDVASSPKSTFVFFTSLTANGGRVHGVELDAKGEPKGGTNVLVEGASSWQILPTPKGALLLAVLGQKQEASRPVAIPIGDGAQPGSTVVLQQDSILGSELEAITIGERIFVGWDQRGPFDLQVKLAALSPDGKLLIPPRTVLRSAGDQGLVGLSAGRGGGLLVSWDDLALTRSPEGRWIRLSSLPADLSTSEAESSLFYALNDGSSPLVKPTSSGYAALTLAPPCKDGDPCAQPPLPVFVRFGFDLAPNLQAPLVLASGSPPSSVWSLYCAGNSCSALGVDNTSSLLLHLEPENNPSWSSVTRRIELPDGPKATKLETLWGGPRLAEVAVAQVGDGWIAASITDHMEGTLPPPLPADADKRGEADKDRAHKRNPKSIPDRGAIVTVHPIQKDGSTAAKTLSLRALSTPGIAVASDLQKKGACIAWVARDNGDPEVFLTLVDAEGKRVAQQMLTRARGDILDVALAPVDGGWIVTWVDMRDGNGEVYAARVDASLRRKGPERRITNAPGDASELALIVQDKTAILAFSDSRDAPTEGVGDVYIARLNAEDASKLADETRVAATPEHGRSLQLRKYGDSILLAWVEQPSAQAIEGKEAQVFVTFLGLDGALRSLPETISLGKSGPLSSLSVQCQAESCRFVAGRPDGRQQWLSAFSWKRGQKEVKTADITALFAGAAADVTPVQGGDWVLVGDDNINQEGRLRRVMIRWP